MKTTSAPTYSTEFINTMAVEETTPFDIVSLQDDLRDAMSKRLLQGPFTVFIDRDTTLEDISLKEFAKRGEPGAAMLVKAIGGIPELMQFNERRRLAEAAWTEKTAMRSNFGRWLQKDEEAIKENSKSPLQRRAAEAIVINTPTGRLVEVAPEKWIKAEHNECIYPLPLIPAHNENLCQGEELSVLPYALSKIQSRKTWKAEQNSAQDPKHYGDITLHYGLPPRTKGRSHVPAYYRITGPSGRTIDLSQPQDQFKPILSSNPPEAFRRFITRLGANIPGGDTELLNRMLKAKKINSANQHGEMSSDFKWLPSYVSQLIEGVWFVRVGWKLNPKCQYGTFHRESADGYVMPFIENAAGELEPFIPGVHSESDILSTSQLDYKLLCEDSGMAVVDKNEDVVSYMNEDEELVMQGFMRDDDHADEDIDNWLIDQVVTNMNCKIDMRVGSAVWLMDDFEPFVFEHTQSVGAQCHSLKKAIASKKAQISDFVLALADGSLIDPDEVTGKLLSAELRSLKWKLDNTRANYRLASEDLKSQVNQTAWFDAHPRECVPTPRSSALDAFSAPLPATVNVTGGHPMAGSNLTIIPGASNEPRNVAVLAEAKITEVDRIVPSVNPLRLLQNGLTRVVKQSDGTYSTRIATKPPVRHTTPKTASPALKLTLLRMMLDGSPLNA